MDHTLLLTKLKAYGIDEHEKHLLADYLQNRLQRVVPNGDVSDWNMSLRGVYVLF